MDAARPARHVGRGRCEQRRAARGESRRARSPGLRRGRAGGDRRRGQGCRVMALAEPVPYVSDYDPFTREAILDAHRHDGAIRELAPAVYLSRYDVWAVARWQQVHDVLRDWETFSSTSRPFFDPKAIRPNILIT